MSYTVLARKYRPQRFDQIVGQEHVTRTIQNAIKMDRVHHAFLMTGVRGIGKTTVARILAKALCCAEAPTPEPCNTCKSCVSITQGLSPDVLEIDGASNTGVDDIRELRENIHFSPGNGRFRVYIIDEVHMLTQNAFNALLKTLEEPPAHVKFIFATTEAHKLPATILSRVQRYDFRRLSVRALVDHLSDVCRWEHISLPEGALTMVAREGGGSVRDSLSLLDQILAFAGDHVTEQDVRQILGVMDRTLMFDLCQALVRGEAATALDIFGSLTAHGYDLRHFLGELAEQVRSLVITSAVPDNEKVLDITPDEAKRLTTLAKEATRDQLLRMFNVLSVSADQILRSPFSHMMLEVLLVRLSEVRPVVGLDRLVESLESLRREGLSPRLPASPPPPPPRQPMAPPPRPDAAPPVATRTGAPAFAPRERATSDFIAAAPRGRTWEGFMAHIKDTLPRIHGMLYPAVPREFSDARVAISYLPEQRVLYETMMIQQQDRDVLTAMLRTFMGNDALVFEVLAPDAILTRPAPPAPPASFTRAAATAAPAAPEPPAEAAPAPGPTRSVTPPPPPDEAPEDDEGAGEQCDEPCEEHGKSMAQLEREREVERQRTITEAVFLSDDMDMLKKTFGDELKVVVKAKPPAGK